jgi:hypothetical protein
LEDVGDEGSGVGGGVRGGANLEYGAMIKLARVQ